MLPVFPLYTIGHSNHTFERFAALLDRHGVELIGEVRSVPASRRDRVPEGHTNTVKVVEMFCNHRNDWWFARFDDE